MTTDELKERSVRVWEIMTEDVEDAATAQMAAGTLFSVAVMLMLMFKFSPLVVTKTFLGACKAVSDGTKKP